MAQSSSFSPPAAPDTPTRPMISLPTLIGTRPPIPTKIRKRVQLMPGTKGQERVGTLDSSRSSSVTRSPSTLAVGILTTR
jgi:hypothetical protein